MVPIIALLYSYSMLTLAACGAGFFILLTCSVFTWFYRHRTSQLTNQAIRLGMALGLAWMAEISINNFIAPALPGRDVIDNIFWAVIALAIFTHACVCAYHARRLLAGIQAGFWSGLVSGIGACGMALSMIVFGMRFITHDPLNLAEWAARGPQTGAPSMAAYFAFETLAGGLMHLVILGLIMGILLGFLGGMLGKISGCLIISC
jgi:hypothetical protein